MSLPKKQGELFDNFDLIHQSNQSSPKLDLDQELLTQWQESIHSYQLKLFTGENLFQSQGSLFAQETESQDTFTNPLKLTPVPLNFWRLPHIDHKGPAIYFVMDQPSSECNLLLYIGETIAAEKRWKGDHDCKKYVDAYLEAFQKANLNTHISIRFWCDVPHKTKARRQLEQILIQKWLPPFNKETRDRWKTPFTSQAHS